MSIELLQAALCSTNTLCTMLVSVDKDVLFMIMMVIFFDKDDGDYNYDNEHIVKSIKIINTN